MALLQRFFGKFLLPRLPLPPPAHPFPRPVCPLPTSPRFPRPAPVAAPPPLPPCKPLSLFRPLGIYIIVLPGSPLNRVAGRDSAGASFRVDVDGRALVISPIKRSRCNVRNVRYLRIYRDPSGVTLLSLLSDRTREIPSIFAREILLYSDCFSGAGATVVKFASAK